MLLEFAGISQGQSNLIYDSIGLDQAILTPLIAGE